MMEFNRTIEYLGLAKCKLENEAVQHIFEQIGRIPFPQDQVEPHLAKLKARDQIIDKNKKLKASKKPEEPVPILDNIEQSTYINAEGQEVQGWVMLKNVQFKHINVCMNDIGDEIKESIVALLRRTNDDFGITLSGNPLSREVIESLQRTAHEIHTNRVNSQPHDPNVNVSTDPHIGIKRIAF